MIRISRSPFRQIVACGSAFAQQSTSTGKTPHCFRHTFATRAYRAGVSEKTLQSMGGWADLKTMQNVYIHTQEEDLENARRLLTLL